jgi:hypothetical protein
MLMGMSETLHNGQIARRHKDTLPMAHECHAIRKNKKPRPDCQGFVGSRYRVPLPCSGRGLTPPVQTRMPMPDALQRSMNSWFVDTGMGFSLKEGVSRIDKQHKTNHAMRQALLVGLS